MQRKPDWLRRPFVWDPNQRTVEGILKELNLNTVCGEANCPNYGECFANKTATFMILGTRCTRGCRFCNVSHGAPDDVDPNEPRNIALAVAKLGLKYVVVTSVTRDDLADGGASHFAETIRAIRQTCPNTAIEVLIPDFKGDTDALKIVTDARPDVISHNMETVKRLYDTVRPEAVYERSLSVLLNIKRLNPNVKSKTGIMVGLGESEEEVLELLNDLRRVGCELLTIGQYLAPSANHHPVIEYIHPDRFAEYAKAAYARGFSFVASAPYVRSSYRAAEAMNE
ncbi:MAG: lipoyl synthase [Oscillospiraceae bacterium]|jgi:lipoic acid synthetase|nr:lipoyl synthase [Oscillospiraceae bacterium]